MKVCIAATFYRAFGGSDGIRGGLIAAIENQKRILDILDIPYTDDPKDSWDVLMVNIPWPTTMRLARRAKKQGRKVIMWAHVSAEDLFQSVRLFQYAPWLKPIVWDYLVRAYAVGDVILCPSHYTKRVMRSFGLSEEKLIVQSNGVDTGRFYPDPPRRAAYRAKLALSGKIVGTVGLVLAHRKGVDTFLDLGRAFPHDQFLWFGKMFNPILVQPPSSERSSNVHFTGFVDDILGALNSLDIFVFPSREENQGMAILEAAAVGLPILVRDLPAYEGWLVHDRNCLIAKEEAEFEQYLRLLLADDALRARLAVGARSLAQRESLEAQTKRMRDIYDDLFTRAAVPNE
jgi:1,2-diacylglycerol-3-alpha-glucose alpha-1,2-glucosyltransferase